MVFVSEQWVLVSILAILVASFIYVERIRSGASISFHEVTRLVNADKAILLDVRDSKDYSAGHIVDALNIPFAKLADRAVELDKHRSKTIVVIDKMGQQAGATCKTLKEKGFDVVRMQGGMSEWSHQNLPVVKS